MDAPQCISPKRVPNILRFNWYHLSFLVPDVRRELSFRKRRRLHASTVKPLRSIDTTGITRPRVSHQSEASSHTQTHNPYESLSRKQHLIRAANCSSYYNPSQQDCQQLAAAGASNHECSTQVAQNEFSTGHSLTERGSCWNISTMGPIQYLSFRTQMKLFFFFK